MMRPVFAMFALAVSGLVLAQAATRPASGGVYTPAQAARGKAAYDATCAACHGGTLAGVEMSPPLAGDRFLANWTGQPAEALAQKIRTTMPQSDPGSLGAAATADVVAYILEANAFHPGAAELPKDATGLQQIVIDGPHASH